MLKMDESVLNDSEVSKEIQRSLSQGKLVEFQVVSSSF